MDQNRWWVVNEIFDAALELPPDERREYVSTASGGDASVACDVERLLVADEQAEGYLETPAAVEFSAVCVTLLSGDVLKGRFRIVRAVGEGGMGKVFEAWDEELSVRVALKVVRPEIASSAATLAAFRREVRIARTITHPNVCRTYDLGRGELRSPGQPDREIVFLTMEFLEGETLAARLGQQGALGLPEALDLALQIASALDAAHTKGTVHRDIKPANIMLVPLSEQGGSRTRAVITDFGLARAESLQQSMQHSVMASSIGGGSPVGTLAYMAPEQMESKGRITPATDVFAFGLVLFEMVTGQRAFPSKNLLSGIAQRLAGPLPTPAAIVPGLPQIWETAISACLRRDPAERFQSAGAVVEALAAGEVLPRARGLTPSKDATKAARWRGTWFRWTMGAVAFLAVVALFAEGLRLYKVREDAPVAPGTLVYLAPVMNRTGERLLDNVTELLRAGLTQSAQINLLEPSRVGDILQNMTRAPETTIDAPIAREIAMRAGAARVVIATVTGGSGKYRLDIDIQRPDPSGVFRYYEHWPMSFDWESNGDGSNGTTVPPELAVKVREATTWVRGKVGESSKDIARLDAPPEDVTTSNWEALKEYSQAQSLARQNQRASAVLALHNAVTKDPQFALAYASMGDMLVSLHRDAEGFQAYDKALDAGLRSRLTRREEDRIRGMRAIDTADYQIAVDAFRDYTINYEDDYVGWVYSTLPLRMLKRDEEAISNLRKALPLAPKMRFIPYALAVELILQNRRDEARRWVAQLHDQGATEIAGNVDLLLAVLDHRYDEAARVVRSLHDSSNPIQRSYSYGDEASLASEIGHDHEAVAHLNQGLMQDQSQGNTAEQAMHLLDRAYLEFKLHDFDGCLHDVHTGYALNQTPGAALRADTVLGDIVAVAPMPVVSKARKELLGIQRTLSPEGYGSLATIVRLRTLGEIQLASGSAALAVTTFERAAAKDAPAGSREYLARAYVAAAVSRHELAAKEDLLAHALQAHAAIALNPAFVWSSPIDFPPGFYGDELEAYVRLADRLHVSNAESRQARSTLSHIRSSAVHGDTPPHRTG